jgi:hypothetical protein
VSANLAILINGEPSSFFRSGRGLRQGCPLSPLLFILAMEALSLLLKLGQADGKITGIKVSRTIKILHLLFRMMSSSCPMILYRNGLRLKRF